MRKVIVREFVSLDGVMQAGPPGRRQGRWVRTGGWQPSYFDDVMGTAIDKGLRTAGGLLLGRRTYEHSPAAGRPPPRIRSPS
jgi:dihydrofolate reductase